MQKPGGLPGEEALKDFSQGRWQRGEVLVEGTGCAKVWRQETGAQSVELLLIHAQAYLQLVSTAAQQGCKERSHFIGKETWPQGQGTCYVREAPLVHGRARPGSLCSEEWGRESRWHRLL